MITTPLVMVIPLLPLVLILMGYGLAGRIPAVSPAERLAVSLLAGLALLAFNLSIVNSFGPVAGLSAWLCLWPIALTASSRVLRRALLADAAIVSRSRKGVLAALVCLGSLVLMSWPELRRSDVVFYDGTSNHDNFFWITGAKHLQQHSYFDAAPLDSVHPWANMTRAVIGWEPLWGRVGAETLLAWVASLMGVDPAKIYLPTVSALFLPWIAAVYLVARTFWINGLSFWGVAALIGLQPMFIYFRANGNLPNLFGIIAGGSLYVSTSRALAATTSSARFAWLALLLLSCHALLFAYPELLPFVALPCGLLIARAAFTRSTTTRLAVLLVTAACLVGCVINPVTGIRAFHGFFHSLETARFTGQWANIFSRLTAVQYVPALTTLSVNGIRYLGSIFGAFATVALLVAAARTFLCARDRFGAAVSLTGGLVLVLYTLSTDFAYGWQKSAQFSAVFIAAMLPTAALASCRFPPAAPRARFRTAGTSAVILIFVIALSLLALDTQRWANRKVVTREWFALGSFARQTLRDSTVLIEPATFNMSFFHGMWAAYFLSETRTVFPARGFQNGGYVRESVVIENPAAPLPPDAILVSRRWADSFDANSPRLFDGDELVLLRHANRVMSLKGFLPAEGTPETAESRMSIELRPHSPSELRLTLEPVDPAAATERTWQFSASIPGREKVESRVAGPPPWRLTVPLTPSQLNRLEFSCAETQGGERLYKVVELKVVSTP